LARAGSTPASGDLEAAIGGAFASGVDSLSANGVIGDPAQARPEHGARYWDEIEKIALDAVG